MLQSFTDGSTGYNAGSSDANGDWDRRDMKRSLFLLICHCLASHLHEDRDLKHEDELRNKAVSHLSVCVVLEISQYCAFVWRVCAISC
jgi:hypothetical protein